MKLTKWQSDLKNKFNKAYNLFKNKKLNKLIITITTNTSSTKFPYFPKLRFFNKNLIFGVVVYSQDQAKDICKLVDKKAEYIFVDSEKKISFNIKNTLNTNKKNLSIYDIDLGHLISICSKNIRFSKLIEFKPNDLTVDSTWLMLSNYFNILSGKNIAIIGAGNIGFKLGLKLVETGASVNLYRRNSDTGVNFANSINSIKPQSTIASANFISDPIRACLFCDAIIASANSSNSINIDMVKVMKPGGIIIDIGKGCIDKKSIKFALDHKITVLRCDINNNIINFISEYLNYPNVTSVVGIKKISKNINIVSGGYIGSYGDIVVDDYKHPKEIIGICNGTGDFKITHSLNDKKRINKLRKIIDD